MSHLHLLAGPNGAGKTTLYERIVGPTTGFEFVNADVIAAAMAAGGPVTPEITYAASDEAARRRDELIATGTSFVTETVFSHSSKVELVEQAKAEGYYVHLHVVLVPVELSVARVRARVANDGHSVPEDKIRARFERLWDLIAQAVPLADDAFFYDNSGRQPLRPVGQLVGGQPIGAVTWPKWTPEPIRRLG